MMSLMVKEHAASALSVESLAMREIVAIPLLECGVPFICEDKMELRR
jgi:hypothetical protein